jgi:hypothetical protein
LNRVVETRREAAAVRASGWLFPRRARLACLFATVIVALGAASGGAAPASASAAAHFRARITKAKINATVGKATFSFDATGGTPTEFVCAIGTAIGTMSTPVKCTSPVSYTRIAPGEHVFGVIAHNASGTSSTLAIRTFTIN